MGFGPVVDRRSKIRGSFSRRKRLCDRENYADHVGVGCIPADRKRTGCDIDCDCVVPESPFGDVPGKRDAMPHPAPAGLDCGAGRIDLDIVNRDSDIGCVTGLYIHRENGIGCNLPVDRERLIGGTIACSGAAIRLYHSRILPDLGPIPASKIGCIPESEPRCFGKPWRVDVDLPGTLRTDCEIGDAVRIDIADICDNGTETRITLRHRDCTNSEIEIVEDLCLSIRSSNDDTGIAVRIDIAGCGYRGSEAGTRRATHVDVRRVVKQRSSVEDVCTIIIGCARDQVICAVVVHISCSCDRDSEFGAAFTADREIHLVFGAVYQRRKLCTAEPDICPVARVRTDYDVCYTVAAEIERCHRYAKEIAARVRVTQFHISVCRVCAQ